MLSFTARGAVRTPTSLQIRVGGHSEPGALRAGAPVPSRALTPAEVLTNLQHFSQGLRTTRTRPCTRLTLSGVGQVPIDLSAARSLGFERIVVHGHASRAVLEAADRIVVRVRAEADLAPWHRRSNLCVTVPVDSALPDDLPRWIAAVLDLAPRRVDFRWPWPGPDSAQPVPPTVARRLEPSIQRLRSAGIEVGLGGLPVCLLGPDAQRARTTNRYYVDADHQGDDALLFFPDIVELARADTCRSCALTARCDGVARRWLEGGGLGVLQPIAVEGAGR